KRRVDDQFRCRRHRHGSRSLREAGAVHQTARQPLEPQDGDQLRRGRRHGILPVLRARERGDDGAPGRDRHHARHRRPRAQRAPSRRDRAAYRSVRLPRGAAHLRMDRTMSDKKKERIDIHEYLAQFDDIPGTRVFTAQRARKGYNLNQFAMSLMKEENRKRFLADESAYLDEWNLTPAAKQAVLDRDYSAMIDEGGNVYFLSKLFSTDGKSFQFAAGSMTGMTQEEYAEMMLKGGRKPDGVRSIKGGY